jgi:proline iminopeptidase
VSWFLHGIAAIFPDAHAQFVGHLPESERDDILGSFLRRLTDPDPAVHMPAARAWSIFEGTCSTLLPSPDTITTFAQDRTALGLARIEAYYFANNLFLPRGGLLGYMDRVRSIPAENDMICPAATAFELANAWRGARLTVVPDAGHSALEPGIRRALVAAVERFRDLR